MPITIVRSTDPITVDSLIACIYAPPGVGKTSLGFTASKPLLLDFDGGAYRAGNRGDSVQVKNWHDVASMSEEDVAPYDTIIVDTAGRCLDKLAADIIRRNPKNGRGGGALSLPGFGILKSDFIAWLTSLREYGKDVVLLAHSDEQRNGDDLIERLDMQGGSKNEVYKCADIMGRLSIKNNKRMLMFSPTDSAFGKNPAGLDPLVVPDFTAEPLFLDSVLKRTKKSLNALTEEQAAVQKVMDEWNARLDECDSAEDFTGCANESAKLDDSVAVNVKRLIVKRASEKGFTYSKALGAFEAAEK